MSGPDRAGRRRSDVLRDDDSTSPGGSRRPERATIEWYDFFIYGTAAALVFAGQFFPNASPVAGHPRRSVDLQVHEPRTAGEAELSDHGQIQVDISVEEPTEQRFRAIGDWIAASAASLMAGGQP